MRHILRIGPTDGAGVEGIESRLVIVGVVLGPGGVDAAVECEGGEKGGAESGGAGGIPGAGPGHIQFPAEGQGEGGGIAQGELQPIRGVGPADGIFSGSEEAVVFPAPRSHVADHGGGVIAAEADFPFVRDAFTRSDGILRNRSGGGGQGAQEECKGSAPVAR